MCLYNFDGTKQVHMRLTKVACTQQSKIILKYFLILCWSVPDISQWCVLLGNCQSMLIAGTRLASSIKGSWLFYTSCTLKYIGVVT